MLGDNLKKNIHTKTCILFWGMMRSGNHAILHFIYNLYSKPKAFLNNREPHKDLRIIRGRRHDLVTKNYTEQILRNLMLISYEDRNISKMKFGNIVPNYKRVIGKINNNFNMLCIRDPFNTFASRSKFRWTYEELRSNPKRSINLWKIYAKECLHITNHVPNKMIVNYNSWISSKFYRKELSAKLNRYFIDDNWNCMTIEGKGSSWSITDGKDGETKTKFVDPHALLTRWKEFKDGALFKLLVKDKELLELSSNLFGDVLNIVN